jgi:hypothetical protein
MTVSAAEAWPDPALLVVKEAVLSKSAHEFVVVWLTRCTVVVAPGASPGGP